MNELVSIIMPSFNSAQTIIESIESVQQQSYQNWELLITDDCSTDKTIEIVNQYAAQDPRIKLFLNKTNSGAAVARNNSIDKSKGTFLAFLDSDDLWYTNKIATQINYFINNKHVGFTFTAYEIIDERGNKLNKYVDLQGENFSVSYEDMLMKKATLGCSTVMLRKDCFEDITMPLIRTGQDYALWLKLLKNNKRAYLINEIQMQYRILPNSISRNKIKKAMRQWAIYRNIESIGYFRSCFYFINYAWRAVFRR